MSESLVLNCTAFFLLLTLWSRKELALSPIDPIYLSWVKELIAFITVSVGYSQRYITDDFIVTFCITFSGYAIYVAILAIFFKRTYKRSVLTVLGFFERDFSSGRLLLGSCFLVYISAAIVFFGAGGDGRIEIYKAIRPIEPLLTVFAPLLMYRLFFAYSRGSKISPFLGVTLLFCVIVIGGKSAILSILLPISYLHFRGHLNLTPRRVLLTLLFCLFGVTMSVGLNYGAANYAQIANIISFRVLMDSDIYILYFQSQFGSQTSVPVFFPYILGPLFKALTLSELVPVNLGAQIGSAVAGFSVPTGPNAHLPVVLEAYTPDIMVQLNVLGILLAGYISCVFLFRSEIYRKSISLSILLLYLVGYFDRIFFDPPAYTLYFLQYLLATILFGVLRYILLKSSRRV